MPTDRRVDPLRYDLGAYDYALPPELVAQEPLAQRDASRLLVLDRATGAIAHRTFADLADLLRPGDFLVTNRSRVFPARLLGRRAGGAATLSPGTRSSARAGGCGRAP